MSGTNKEQSLLSKIKDQVAVEFGYDDWYQIDCLEIEEGERAIIQLSIMNVVVDKYATEKAKEIDYVLDQSYDALRIAANILQARTRETAADRQIEFAERLVKWARDGQKGTMPAWFPDHEPEPIKVYFRSEVESCIKDSLQAAAENAETKRYGCTVYCGTCDHGCENTFEQINPDSITDPSNIKIK